MSGAANVASRLETNTSFIRDLTREIGKGEVKTPKFQRKFVWKSKQALDLLDSIAHNYPMGSLLLWLTPNKLVAERNIGEFRLPDTGDLTPTNYVLDGQQRITVIYSCLGAPVSEGGFAAAYDLERESFVELPPKPQLHLFPLRLMLVMPQLLNFRTALQAHPNGAAMQPRLDALIETFSNYKIPVVTLKDLTVEEVAPIFERINSSGTRLSTYDLMVAATWSATFDLNDEAAKISDALEPKGFDDIEGDTVIKCLSAIHTKSVAREDILALRKLKPTDIDALTTRAKDALLRSVDLLSTEFGIYSWDFLPYEALAIVLSSIYSEAVVLNREQVKRVREWFWRASFGERYRGASENFISNDIKTVHQFVVDGKGSPDTFGGVPSAPVLRDIDFRANNSRSRAFTLALAARGPRNLTNGATIDVAEALSAYNKKQFHHIYPKAFLKRISKDEEANSIVNICMLAASENNRISDTEPNTYLPDYVKALDGEAEAVFASNMLPSPSSVDYSTLDYDTFLDTRAVILHTAIGTLCRGESL